MSFEISQLLNMTFAMITKKIIFLSMAMLISCFCKTNSCMESERIALLQFKQGLNDPGNRLSSWFGNDCCMWGGVICDNSTAHVRQLRLRNPFGFPPVFGSDTIFSFDHYEAAYLRNALGGELSSSLLNLKYLDHLDLSGNDFQGIPIPNFIGSLENLVYLNLSGAGFGGAIPYQLGNLTKMRFLGLRGSLSADNLGWLSGLPSLKYLDMSSTDLRKALDWLQVISSLPSLVELYLSGCQLNNATSSVATTNISTSLAILDLSFSFYLNPAWVFSLNNLVSLDIFNCRFYGPVPSGLQNMTGLEFLALGQNRLTGGIPNAIANMSSLVSLDLRFCELEGKIPRFLGDLCNLKHLALSGNNFEFVKGDLFESLKFLFGCFSNQLESLKFDSSGLSGHFSHQFGLLENLRHLSMSNNSNSGPISSAIQKLSFLKHLDLSENKLNGILPEFLGQFRMLEVLRISYNQFQGVVSESHFANLTRLRVLDARENKLIFKPSNKWIPPFQLVQLELRSWQLGPRFPRWIQSQRYLEVVSLAKTGISDFIPTWLWNISSNFRALNLSHNQIYGEIPNLLHIRYSSSIDLSFNHIGGPLPVISSFISFMDLSSNSFSGALHQFLCNEADIPNKLRYLNLANNHLTGMIPDCWIKWKNLAEINLENNSFEGRIPSSFGCLTFLESLKLRKNHLFGKLPSSLQNCTNMFILDLSENKFEDRIPAWIGNISTLIVLNLRSNKFYGEIHPELCRLTLLHILDLGFNNLSGTVPSCFSNFIAMTKKYENKFLLYSLNFKTEVLTMKGREDEYSTILSLVTTLDLSRNNLSGTIPDELTRLRQLLSLNLSRNQLIGRIPENIGDMGSLESLDLSANHFSGEIPVSISRLTLLNHLNLSYNNLTGKIPTSTQLQSFDNSSFAGNLLCGPPLTISCEQDEASTNGDENEDRINWFLVSMALGFGVGFGAVVCIPLLINQTGRIAYYSFMDRMGVELYYFLSRCF